MSKFKLPKDPRRKKQVETYLTKHGREGYAKAGAKGGGKNSPGSFTSESASRAASIGWANRRARAAEESRRLREEGNV